MLFIEELKDLALKKNEKTRNAIYRQIAFFAIGSAVGVGLNDLWRLLNLPGDNEEILIHGEKRGLMWDEIYQGMIAAMVGSLELFGFKNATTIAAGMGFGIAIAAKSERRGYVGFL